MLNNNPTFFGSFKPKIIKLFRLEDHTITMKIKNNNFVKFSIILWVTRFDLTNSNRTSCCAHVRLFNIICIDCTNKIFLMNKVIFDLMLY